MARKLGFICVVALLILNSSLQSPGQSNNPVQYIYDDLGRLITVIDPSGNFATYTYDAVGNILSISRSSLVPNALVVLNVLPRSGTVGTLVTIQGQGFSASAAANNVEFNGTPAPVVSAATTLLTVSVPAAATSGPLTVTVGGVTAQGGNFTVLPATVLSFSINALSTSLQVGTTEQLSAIGVLNTGDSSDLTALVTWSSSNPAVITVSNASGSQGRATAIGPGFCIVTAAFNNLTRTIPMSVGNLTGLQITPALPVIRIPKGGTQQLKVLGKFSNGDTVDLSSFATWSSATPAVATVDNSGLATGVAPGGVQISANVSFNGSSATGTASVSVFSLSSITVSPQDLTLPVGAVQNFTANAYFSDGVTQDVTSSVTWSTSDNQLAGVANGAPNSGLVTTVRPGAVAVIATYNNLAAAGISAPVSGSGPVIVNGTAPPAVSPRFAYIPNLNDGTISQYTVDAGTGQLRSNGYLFDGILRSDHASSGTGIATDPAGKFVFVTNSGNDSISAFTVNSSSGNLTPVAGSPFAVVPGALTAQIPQSVAVDSLGRYLYCANRGGASISGFAINSSTGALTPVPGSPVVGGTGGPPQESPAWVAIDPGAKFVFVAESGVNKVAVYSINQQTGSLAEIAASPFPAGNTPIQLVVHPSGKFLYVANAGDRTISEFTIDSTTGNLTADGTVSVNAINIELPLAITPSGQFAYVLNPSGILGFSIDPSSGTFTPLAGSPFPVNLTGGEVIAVDPSGSFVYAQDEQGSGVATFGIDPNNGSLVLLNQAGTRPNPVAMIVSGSTTPLSRVPKFAYSANSGSNNLSAYTIDPVTEALVVNPSSPFTDPFKPVNVTSDPAGKFVFVTNQCSDAACQSPAGSISVYTIDSSTGSLTPVSGSPFSAGSGAFVSAVDPTGRFLYAVNGVDNTISAYGITPGTGVLTPISGSPFSVGFTVFAMTIASTGKFAYVMFTCDPLVCVNLVEVATFSIDASTGALSSLPNPALANPSSSATSDPLSRFEFLSNSSGISVFAMNPTFGVLTPVPFSGQEFAAGSSPVSPIVDPSGRFLYIVNNGDNTVSGYSVDGFTGTLWPMAGSPFPVGKKPTSAIIDVTGLTLYVTNSVDGTVSAFAIDPILGTLEPLIGSPYAAGTTPVSITVTGKTQ